MSDQIIEKKKRRTKAQVLKDKQQKPVVSVPKIEEQVKSVRKQGQQKPVVSVPKIEEQVKSVRKQGQPRKKVETINNNQDIFYQLQPWPFPKERPYEGPKIKLPAFEDNGVKFDIVKPTPKISWLKKIKAWFNDKD